MRYASAKMLRVYFYCESIVNVHSKIVFSIHFRTTNVQRVKRFSSALRKHVFEEKQWADQCWNAISRLSKVLNNAKQTMLTKRINRTKPNGLIFWQRYGEGLENQCYSVEDDEKQIEQGALVRQHEDTTRRGTSW